MKIIYLLSIEGDSITYTSRVFESKCTFDNIISTRRINWKIHLKQIFTNVFNSSEFSKPGRKILLKSKLGYGSISPRTIPIKSIIPKKTLYFLPVSHRGLGLYICAGNTRLFFPTIPGGIADAALIHKIF